MRHMCFIITVTHRLLTLTHKMRTFVAVLALVAAVAADVSHLKSQAQILRQEADVFPDQYQFVYETSNGISAQESGSLKNISPGNDAISSQGSYSYTDPNGVKIELSYTADENGFHPQASHLPTPPPTEAIPEYILRAVAYNAAHPPKPEPGSKF